jgi:hypothetical protein
MKKTKINTNLLRKLSLKDKILKEDCSIAQAAAAFEMLPCEAEEILFNKKVSTKNVFDAVKLYQKGHSIKNSSVASGVKPSILIGVLKTIRSKSVANHHFKDAVSWIV